MAAVRTARKVPVKRAPAKKVAAKPPMTASEAIGTTLRIAKRLAEEAGHCEVYDEIVAEVIYQLEHQHDVIVPSDVIPAQEDEFGLNFKVKYPRDSSVYGTNLAAVVYEALGGEVECGGVTVTITAVEW